MHKSFRKVPIILQSEAAECGAVSLAMILAYYKHYVDLPVLRKECKISRDGSRMSYVMQAAEAHGLKARAMRCRYTLEGISLPCIVFWDNNHFLVVEKIKKDRYFLCDPAAGRRTVTKDEFLKHFSAVAMDFEKTEHFEEYGRSFSLFSSLTKITGTDTNANIYLMLIVLMINLLGVALPAMNRIFVDVYFPSISSLNEIKFLGIYALMILAQCALVVLQTVTISNFEWRLSSKAASNVLRHALLLPISFFERRSHSSLSSKLESLDSLCSFVASNFVPMILNLIFAAVYMAAMFIYDLSLTIIILIFFALILAVMALLIKKSDESTQKSTNDGRLFYGSVVQTVKLYDTIKASSGEEQAFENLTDDYFNYENAISKSSEIASYIASIPIAIPVFFQILVLTICGLKIADGSMTTGLMLAYQGIAMSFFAPVCRLVTQFNQLQSLKINVIGIREILTEETDPMNERPTSEEGGRARGSIEFEHVSFGYNPGAEPFIKDMNLEIKEGESVAFVGGSGSGKTTILRLIEGLIVPQDGTVKIDGVPLIDTKKDIIAGSMGIVTQQPFIYKGTVRENLTMFDSSVPRSAIYRAAKSACIYDEIMGLNGGFNAELLEGGKNISGGQRQRIMIARALLKNPSILILDEASSALDTIVEEKIMRHIRSKKMTVIISAHRLSTIRDCDKIVVLDKGKIMEIGSHEELMRIEDGIYKKLISVEDGLK